MNKLNKIYILGPAGSGKSFLANKLSKLLDIPHYDLDEIYWIEKATKKRPESKWKPMLNKILKNNKWIIEGVFSSWVDNALKKADAIIWLDFSSKIISWRIFKRYIKEKITGKKVFIKDALFLINYSKQYTKRTAKQYNWHKKLLNKNKLNFILIKNNKQLN